jgi:hypothetical protein
MFRQEPRSEDLHYPGRTVKAETAKLLGAGIGPKL